MIVQLVALYNALIHSIRVLLSRKKVHNAPMEPEPTTAEPLKEGAGGFKIYSIQSVTTGGRHAWFDSSEGRIRKPIGKT